MSFLGSKFFTCQNRNLMTMRSAVLILAIILSLASRVASLGKFLSHKDMLTSNRLTGFSSTQLSVAAGACNDRPTCNGFGCTDINDLPKMQCYLADDSWTSGSALTAATNAIFYAKIKSCRHDTCTEDKTCADTPYISKAGIAYTCCPNTFNCGPDCNIPNFELTYDSFHKGPKLTPLPLYGYNKLECQNHCTNYDECKSVVFIKIDNQPTECILKISDHLEYPLQFRITAGRRLHYYYRTRRCESYV
ncbi:Uncharacterised protein g4038 [Pycnogonum litorale]